MNIPAAIALGGLSVSTGLHAAASLALLRLRKTSRGQVLPHFAPPVSILKPLSGLDDGLEENLESFFRLDYRRYEVVFSFASDADPAYPIARLVADRHPRIPSTFVFDERDGGGNAKIDRLAAALEKSRHRMILTSDGNVRVRPDFLSRAVSHFAQSGVGLVSHLFLATGAVTPASRIESLYLNGCLQPGTAAVSGILGIPCVTLRANTERPITCEIGTNLLVGTRPDCIREGAFGVLAGRERKSSIPKYWDGQAAERIVRIIMGARQAAVA